MQKRKKGQPHKGWKGAARKKHENTLRDAKGRQRAPGHDPKTGRYSTAQMMADEMFGGDPSLPLFD